MTHKNIGENFDDFLKKDGIVTDLKGWLDIQYKQIDKLIYEYNKVAEKHDEDVILAFKSTKEERDTFFLALQKQELNKNEGVSNGKL